MWTYIYSLLTILVLMGCGSSSSSDPERSGGIALYTLRSEMKEDPKSTLTRVAEIGYRYVEDAGYEEGAFYGMKPEIYKALLEELDLIPVSAHQAGITYENMDQVIADVKAVGFQYLVIPIPPMGYFTIDEKSSSMGMSCSAAELAEILDTVGQQCRDNGLRLLYHNHDFEFREDSSGIIPMEYLLENTDPRLVNFELDIYWAIKAGVDPIDLFRQYPGRFKAWHLKDMDAQGRFAPIGAGEIDFARLLELNDLAGMEYTFVEQDETYDDMTPFQAIEISHTAIEQLGYD